jgi:hypothetical protein
MPFTDQGAYDVRFEQGEQGLQALAGSGVDVAVARGARLSRISGKTALS